MARISNNTPQPICICGHPLSRHVLVGTEYARCEMFSTTPCKCSMAARAVLMVSGGLIQGFTRTHRGGQLPHALDKGIAGYAGTVTWLVDECDRCGGESSELRAVALNSRGVPMLGLTPWTTFDSGKHMLLCPACWDEVEEKNKSTLDAEFGY